MEECTICGKVLKNKIGLSGHLRSHKAKVEVDTNKEPETPVIEENEATEGVKFEVKSLMTLKGICDQLFKQEKSGEARSVFVAYAQLETDKPLKEVLESMRDERLIKDGQTKAKIQNYINKL